MSVIALFPEEGGHVNHSLLEASDDVAGVVGAECKNLKILQLASEIFVFAKNYDQVLALWRITPVNQPIDEVAYLCCRVEEAGSLPSSIEVSTSAYSGTCRRIVIQTLANGHVRIVYYRESFAEDTPQYCTSFLVAPYVKTHGEQVFTHALTLRSEW